MANDPQTRVKRGSGNIFADLEIPDAEDHQIKAELVTHIDGIVRNRRLTEMDAAELLGLLQPEVSRLLRGNFREYSIECLLRLLMALGCDVDIVIRKQKSRCQGKLSIDAA